MTLDGQRFAAVFRAYDMNHDRYLTQADLAAYADQLCETIGHADLRRHRHALQDAYAELWSQLSTVADIDRSGQISEQEYIAAMAHGAVRGDKHFRASTLKAIDVLAEALDLDGSGYIETTEYAKVFAITGLSRPGSYPEFGDLDKDGDGRLTRTEFRAAAAAFFPLASADWLDEQTNVALRQYGVALVAHDSRKTDMLTWAAENRERLAKHRLYGTGTTSRLLADQLSLPVLALRSGPLGGDQQIGALIADGEIDLLVFFWDPLASHPHGADVKALIRLAVLANVAIACNRATADLVIEALGSHRN
jgi:methylglyoxal synthase